MDVPIPQVVFEAAGYWVDAPDAKLGTIESQLQPIVVVLEPIVAVLERRFVAPPFGKQRSEHHS